MSKKTFATILLISVPAIIAFGSYQEMGRKVILDVPLIKQQTKMWCWATSAQMIMTFMGKPISQCEQANIQLKKSDCCTDSIPKYCVKGGWPQFYRYEFTSDSVDAALSWEQLKAQIDNQQPVVFSWRWTLGGGHMMVATGYAEPNWVYVNNPFPPQGDPNLPEGDHQIITYEEFVSSTDHEHWRDYYNIQPRPKVPAPIITQSRPQPAATVQVAEVTTTAPNREVASGQTTEFVPYDRKPAPIGGFEAIQRALQYPDEARRARWEGRTIINVLVAKDGAVKETKVLQSAGHESLDGAAIAAIRSVRWNAARQRESPVEVWVAIPISFKLR
ncbi:MAG TPA: TonB family protein [bacterium]